jgi:hypothetical protein
MVCGPVAGQREGRRLNMMPEYVALVVHHRRNFIFGVAAVFLLAGAFLVAAHTTVVWGSGYEDAHELAGGFGDAFIIAGVLAILVDPVAQHKFATEWGHDLYWEIFSPRAPQEFRDAVQAIAAPHAYINRCRFELEFRPPDAGSERFFELDLRISFDAMSLDRRGFLLTDRLVAVGRHDGTPSRYTFWSFKREDSDRIAFDETQLKNLGVISVDNSGRTVLDQSKIPAINPVPCGQKYYVERHFVTSRWVVDYVPLFQPRIILGQDIVIKGTPVPKLDFSITQLGGSGTPAKLAKRVGPGGDVELYCKLDEVAFPGQASMVAWRPKVASAQAASG